MTPHPDQLTPQEAASAVNILSGLTERLSFLRYKIEVLECMSEQKLPAAAQVEAQEATTRSNMKLAEVQRAAAEAACDILAHMDLLEPRLRKAWEGLAAYLASVEEVEANQAADEAFAAEHFGKAA